MNDEIKMNGSLSEKADAAFEQAAAKAVEKAKQTSTPVIVWEGDHVQEVAPDEIIEHQKPDTEH